MYTIWTDYGYEGWNPEDYETMEDLQDALKATCGYKEKVRVTTDLPYYVKFTETIGDRDDM